MVSAVLITGAPGTGKSSTLEALTTLLDVEGVRYGALEAEQLAWGGPWLSVEEAAVQLDAVLALQRRSGRRLFLIAAGVESVEELRTVLGAVRADLLLVVCMSASAETVAARLEQRESDRWPGKRDLIARARKLTRTVPGVEGIDRVIHTETVDAEQVAAEICQEMRTRGLLQDA